VEFEPNASNRWLGNTSWASLLSIGEDVSRKALWCHLAESQRDNLRERSSNYDAEDGNQTSFFLQAGFVKIGSITEDGHELIYDVRKAGDIVGELCASGQQRQDRAVALERTEVIPVPLDEVLEIVQKDRLLLQELVQMFCESLSDAYDQLNTLASSDTVPPVG
jgi:CRP-like cAMP-binding protein